MTEREKLIEICEDLILSCKADLCADCEHNKINYPHCMGVHFADHLLSNGVIVTPRVAMVEQFIKDGKFDKKHTAHNGRFAVVYIDKTKSKNYALIDITEQFYNTEKADERIKALKERSEGK